MARIFCILKVLVPFCCCAEATFFPAEAYTAARAVLKKCLFSRPESRRSNRFCKSNETFSCLRAGLCVYVFSDLSSFYFCMEAPHYYYTPPYPVFSFVYVRGGGVLCLSLSRDLLALICTKATACEKVLFLARGKLSANCNP